MWIIEGNWQDPLAAISLHSGHQVSSGAAGFLAVSASQRLAEEDPFTDALTSVAPNWIMVKQSRFEFDLNRNPEKAIHLSFQDDWDFKIWKCELPGELIETLRGWHQRFYRELDGYFTALTKQFGRFVVLSLHSFSGKRVKDAGRNPDIDVGTWLNSPEWQKFERIFIAGLAQSDFLGQRLEVGRNARFPKPAFFEEWLSRHFPKSCCLSVEFKKSLFMDEQTGKLGFEKFEALRRLLSQATDEAMAEFNLMP